jgi:hypothetical protein
MDWVFLGEFFDLDDPGFIPHHPGDDLSGVFEILGLDDRPAGVDSVVASPIELM